MQRSGCLYLLPFIFILGACGKGSDEPFRKLPPGITRTDYDRFVNLNRMQQDMVDARESVHGQLYPSISEKAEAMGKLMANPNCVRNVPMPEDDLSGVVTQQTIAGANCPIRWSRTRGWTVANKSQQMLDNLTVLSADFRKNYMPLNERVVSGAYGVTTESGGGYRVSGRTQNLRIATVSEGVYQGQISVDQVVRDDQGKGIVYLELNSSTSGRINAKITWTFRNNMATQIEYSINDAKVDKTQFAEAFSSYELDIIMDNTVRMK